MMRFLGILFFATLLSAEVIAPFAIRYSQNTNGNIALIGNTLMSAPTKLHVDGEPPIDLANDAIDMVYVKTDPKMSNSSSATLALKNGSEVLYAALYWGARSNSSDARKGTITLKTPAGKTHTLKADAVHSAAIKGYYAAVANVTGHIQSTPNGTYTVGNIDALTGADAFAGWSLVVVYRNATMPLRSMTLFDGYAIIPPTVTIDVTGFKSPKDGEFSTFLSAIAFEGDVAATGDSLQLNGTSVTDRANSVDNFFNSQITLGGEPFTAKTPNYRNQMGVDIKQIDVTGLVKNGDESAQITFATDKDYYQAVALAFVTDYATDLAHTQSVSTTAPVKHGSSVTLTSTLYNNAPRSVAQLGFGHSLPDGLTYIPNSMQLDGRALEATYEKGRIQASIPAIDANSSVTLTYDVQVALPDTVPFGTRIETQAELAYDIENLGIRISVPSDYNTSHPDAQATPILVEEAPDSLGLIEREASFAQVTLERGRTLMLTSTITNPAPFDAANVRSTIVLPSTLGYVPNSFIANGQKRAHAHTEGNISVDLGFLPKGKSMAIAYQVEVLGEPKELQTRTYDIAKTLTYTIQGDKKAHTSTSTQTVRIGEDVRYKTAKTLYGEGNFTEAKELFDTLFLEHMGSLELNHYLAQSAHKAKSYDAALAAYERVLILDEYNGDYNLDVATLYVDTQGYTEAKALLDTLKELTPAQEARKNVLLQRIDDARQRHTLVAVVNANIGYDTNVNASAGSTVLADYYNELNATGAATTDPIGDLYTTAMAMLIDIYDIGDKDGWYLQGMAMGLSKFYLSQTSYNLLFAKLSGTVGLKEGAWKLTMPIEFDHIVFGGKNLMGVPTLGGTVSYQQDKVFSYGTGVKYQYKSYYETTDPSRNAHTGTGHLNVRYSDAGHTITATYQMQLTKGSSAQYVRNWSNGLTLSYATTLPWEQINVTANLKFRHILYDDAVSDTSDVKRTDDQSGIALSGVKQLWQALGLKATYMWDNSTSNYAPVKYQKHAIEVGVNYTF